MSNSSTQFPTRADRLDFISLMANHPVAANLLMIMMLLAGLWAIRHINTQLLPSFDIDLVTVRVVWSGASTEDVEELITAPLEQALRDVDFIREMTSASSEGVSVVTLEFEEGADIGLVMDRVKQKVDQVRNLPADAEEPVIQQTISYEKVGRILITGGASLDQLRPVVNRMEQELLDRGINRVEIRGLPQEQIAIEVPSRQLHELGLSLDEVARRISARSKNAPIGLIGNAETSRQLRFQERRNSSLEFETIPIVAEDEGRLVRLGDIAQIHRKPLDGQQTLSKQGMPAVELSLLRSRDSDSIEAAKIMSRWVEETRQTLPPGVELILYDQQWELLNSRINILIKNGISGLILVLAILFLFLQRHVAFWTAVGIPVSFMAALGVLYAIGGSLNMVSTFGMIMALGIIVDDAIVVGEETMTQFSRSGNPAGVAENAAKRMLGPVFASSLTTIAAFFPLIIISGAIGVIMAAIPVVVICIIVVSLIECFLILPGHLNHSLRRMRPSRGPRIRQKLDRAFEFYRDRLFRPLIRVAVRVPMTVMAIALTMLIVTVGWISSGRIAFEFFPTAEEGRLFANVSFVTGTPAHVVSDYLEDMQRALYEVEQEYGQPFVKLMLATQGAHQGIESRSSTLGSRSSVGDHLGSIRLEMIDPSLRTVRNHQIISAWKERLPPAPGREILTILEPRAGPPGADIDIRLIGDDIYQVKDAANRLTATLRQIPGVYGVSDDTPYGREQMVLELTPVAEALGLSVESISAQLRAAYDGILIQEISDGYDEIEVRVSLPQADRYSLASLEEMNIILPGGQAESLANLVNVRLERGFDTIRHSGIQLSITVKGSVDPAIANSNRIRAELERSILPALSSEGGVRFNFEGRQADQASTLDDMRFSLIPALGMIYLVLAWIFRSYAWPLIVMSIIPFGIIGAIWGHVALGLNLTVVSLMGIFCLSGIVVNNSIILVIFYRTLKSRGMAPEEAVVEAACQRLRAVTLTSLTTIGGLTPLLFETELAAQFLIPMATGIAFGLMFATLLVLFLVPALLLAFEKAKLRVIGSAPQHVG